MSNTNFNDQFQETDLSQDDDGFISPSPSSNLEQQETLEEHSRDSKNTEVTGEEALQEPAETISQSEQYHSSEELESLRDHFKDLSEKWKNSSPSERLDLAQQLENRLADIQGRPPCRVINDDLQDDLGRFTENGDIIVDTQRVMNACHPDYMVRTIAHEGRHAYQEYAIKNPGVHKDGTELNVWADNMAEYFTKDEHGKFAYENQPIEKDVRSYSKVIANTILPDRSLSPENDQNYTEKSQSIWKDINDSKDGNELQEKLEKKGYALSKDDSDRVVLVDYKGRTFPLTEKIEDSQAKGRSMDHLSINTENLPKVEEAREKKVKEVHAWQKKENQDALKEKERIAASYEQNEANMRAKGCNEKTIERNYLNKIREISNVDRRLQETIDKYDQRQENKLMGNEQSHKHGISM